MTYAYINTDIIDDIHINNDINNVILIKISLIYTYMNNDIDHDISIHNDVNNDI